MAIRTIELYPEQSYDFQPNAHFREPWKFLPHNDRSRIIGEQLTYLAFHEWLMTNLKHKTLKTAKGSELISSVAEGFYKTDVLLLASICEAAPYSVLHSLFETSGSTAHVDVKRCFEKSEPKVHILHKPPIETTVGTNTQKATIALTWTQTKLLADSEVQFLSLIKAGKSAGIYDASLRKRLDEIRDDRNAIHLANHIKRKDKRSTFNASDRDVAKQTTEDLRSALEAYVKKEKVI